MCEQTKSTENKQQPSYADMMSRMMGKVGEGSCCAEMIAKCCGTEGEKNEDNAVEKAPACGC